MAGDAAMQPAGSVESLSDLAGFIDSEETEQVEPGVEGEEQEVAPEGEQEQEVEQQEEEQEDGGEDTITLKHDGKELPFKKSEVIELAQKGYDYSTKTMALAEDRKVVEATKAQADEYRQHNEKALEATLGRLNAFVEFMGTQVGTPPPASLAQQDVGLYVAQKEQYETRKGQLDRALAAIEHVKGETQQKRQAWIAQQADETEKALRDTLPGFGENTISELAGYLGKAGISPQTAEAGYVQKGLWEIAAKAKAYDQLQAKTATLKPVAQLPRVAKPQASNQPNRAAVSKSDAMKRYHANPSLTSLGDLLA